MKSFLGLNTHIEEKNEKRSILYIFSEHIQNFYTIPSHFNEANIYIPTYKTQLQPLFQRVFNRSQNLMSD